VSEELDFYSTKILPCAGIWVREVVYLSIHLSGCLLDILSQFECWDLVPILHKSQRNGTKRAEGIFEIFSGSAELQDPYQYYGMVLLFDVKTTSPKIEFNMGSVLEEQLI